MRRPTDLQQGTALVLALIVTIIMSALLSGLLLLSVSHLSLSQTNNDYANALNLAEAGVNREVWKLTNEAAEADLEWSAWTRFPAAQDSPRHPPRWYRMKIEPVDPSGAWAPPARCWVIGQGNVAGQAEAGGATMRGGVTRTVRFMAEGKGLFGLYALFGINSLTSRGGLVVDGAAGSDGLVDASGNAQFMDDFWYCGAAAGSEDFLNQGPPTSDKDPVKGIVYDSPLSVPFPTVNEMAAAEAKQVWGASEPPAITVDYFRAHNNNDLIHTTGGASVTIENYGIDIHTFKDIADGIIVLPPGDYYFESLELPSTNTLKLDTAAGAVNIWLGPEGGQGRDDTINGQMLFTGADASKFHLYDGSARTLRLNGTMDFYGNVLAYNGSPGNYYGSVQINGDGNIWGSVLAYDVVKSTGNATITFPSHGGGGSPVPGEPIIYLGVEHSWEEVNPL